MFRQSWKWLAGATLAALLAGCGGSNSLLFVAQAFIQPCPEITYQDVLWSPDAAHIAFVAFRQGSEPQIYVMNADGTGANAILAAPFFSYGLQWSPDGQMLANATPITAHITRVTLDGQETLVRLARPLISSLSLSPHGSQVAYSTLTSGSQLNPDIYRINFDGTSETRLTDDPAAERSLAWSPDGQWIAYLRADGQGRITVNIMRADGSEKRELADGYDAVRWSPDGQWLSYMSNRSGRQEVTIKRVDGTDERTIPLNASIKELYAWLLDSRHISFISPPPDYHLMVIDIDTLQIEDLTQIDLVDTAGAPSWSPDGKQVVFIGYDHSNPNVAVQALYLMNRDGSGLKRITDNPGKATCLHWPF